MRKIFLTGLFLGVSVTPLFLEAQRTEGAIVPVLQALDQPVFVVTRNHFAEGYEPDSAKFGDLLMIEVIPAGHTSESLKDYEVGQNYQVLRGGEIHGTAHVDRIVKLQCDSSAAIVTTGASIKIPKNGFALATRSKIVQSHPSHLAKLSEKENEQVLKLVAEEFKKRKVKVKSLSEIRTGNMTQTQLGPDTSKSIVGNFYIKSAETLDRLFLIVEYHGETLRPTLTEYHHSIDIEDGKDDEKEMFADQIDLGGDGKDEIITQVTGYEFEAFSIYEHKKMVGLRSGRVVLVVVDFLVVRDGEVFALTVRTF